MATSGSYDYSRTAAQIIASAYEDLGVIAPGGSVVSADSTMALSRLNMLVKQLQGTSDLAPGLKIWTRQRITMLMALGQQTYLIGPASTDARASTQVGRTTISAAEAAGQTVLSVTSNTDTTSYPGTTITMTDGDFVGIQTDDSGGDDIFWTTISGTPGATMTIASALPTGRPAASGNYVWWFTSRAQRFPVIESARLRTSSRNDTELYIYRDAREYDLGVVDKYADGDPTSILVEPLRITTRLTLDSQPTDVTKTIELTALYPSEDYDATTDDIAFPQEYFALLHWELASWLSVPKGRPWTPKMEQNRQAVWTMARSLNPEVCNLYFQPGGL